VEAAGVVVRRVASTVFVPRPRREWLATLSPSRADDVLLVTSRRGVDYGLLPYLRSRSPTAAVCWAVGPRTATAARSKTGLAVRFPHRPGSPGLVAALGSTPPRRILYFRSDLAGPGLARTLRRRGHRVREVVVYRGRPAEALRPADRRFLRRANCWVVSSPSALRHLRARLGPRSWILHLASTPVAVLGERTARRARALGFRRVVELRPGRPQRFTRRLLDEVARAAE
jgi:uroporphyrinogen-III synthase